MPRAPTECPTEIIVTLYAAEYPSATVKPDQQSGDSTGVSGGTIEAGHSSTGVNLSDFGHFYR
jgi:hypothetical protein